MPQFLIHIKIYYKFLILLFGIFALTSCTSIINNNKSQKLILQKAKYSDLLGWKQDNMNDVFMAFSKSCSRILKNDPQKPFGILKQAGTNSDWQPLCEKLLNNKNINLTAFFEENFTPYAASNNKNHTGLFTGYYEANLYGSKKKSDKYNIPLYSPPNDLITVDLGLFKSDLKGQKIIGRIKDKSLIPYATRYEITNYDNVKNDDVLVWVDSAIDAFFLQIQGSGIINLDDGSKLRIGYAEQNGHPYYAIGKELIKRKEISKDKISMQSIKAWLIAHPDQADEIMNLNKSYIFFKNINEEGPIGAENIVLTPLRSMAIDNKLLSYGLPIWVDIEKPTFYPTNIQHLMFAQDTGGAIKGSIRGDIFWGYGPKAEIIAGAMNSKGRYWILLPNSIEIKN